MTRRKKTHPAQMALLEVAISAAPCVPRIREEVQEWTSKGYKGVTPTTQTLLNHWFHCDHRLPNGRKFSYYPFQREAIETLIYIYEVAGKHRHKELLEAYATADNLRLLQYDQFPRYCLKMATGTGKTKIISLAIAWQYFNAVLENADDYAPTTLVIAPNIIVFERLKLDFIGGKIFEIDPVIPPSLEIFWDFECYMRGDNERASSRGALYLTNIHQLYERDDTDNSEPDIVTRVLGSKPPSQTISVEPFDERILRRGGPVFIVNDEAHHTHDEENEWNRAIRQLHQGFANRGENGVLQLDMTAIPRYPRGSLFPWTIYDYPLKQAILDNVVKRPVKGTAQGLRETPSDVASIKYQTYLTAGVNRWREYRDQLKRLNRKPVLFVMMNTTKEACDVADYLRSKYPGDFAGDKLNILHVNMRGKNKGEISKKDLELARKLAQEIDNSDNPTNCIVSVLMLREGWNAQNVTVVVGLRPYTNKANILPEQTIGRGLRLMFRGINVGEEATFRERVDVIGNKAFIEFVERLEQEEDLEFDTINLDEEPVIIDTIHPDPNKLDMDIKIPFLFPMLARKRTLAEEIKAIEVSNIKAPTLPKKEGDDAALKFQYKGFDLITLEKIIEQEYTIPEVRTSQEVISNYAKRIAADVKLPSQFAYLVPKVREFLVHYAFGETVDLDTPEMIKAISHPVAQHVTVKAFVAILREAIVQEQIQYLEHKGRPLSKCEGFPWSRPTLEASKTVFNLVAADNEYEKSFAEFLQDADDVLRFAKLPSRFGFSIPYTDTRANLRYYEPDFVAVTNDGIHHLIETKGREDVDVARKNRAARLWCENATKLTDDEWQFKIVMQKEFERLGPDDFVDLIALEPIKLLWGELSKERGRNAEEYK
jgi:type III restriction enzyme